jgi:hypothetical protein
VTLPHDPGRGSDYTVIKTNRRKKALGNFKSRCLTATLSPEDLACHLGAVVSKASNTGLALVGGGA